jgi:hypothetical protein
MILATILFPTCWSQQGYPLRSCLAIAFDRPGLEAR